eukprot:6455022-Amphidinium_carterae.1
MGCLTWEFTEGKTPGTCASGACEWTVCVTLSLGAEGCVKSATDSISHICQKDDSTCTPAEGFTDATEIGSGPLVNDKGKQCQTGAPGEDLTFLFKDGPRCDDSATVAEVPFDAAISCKPRPEAIPSCTGNSAGKECVWTVSLPDADQCGAPTTPTTTTTTTIT